jgi:hypothetical protein
VCDAARASLYTSCRLADVHSYDLHRHLWPEQLVAALRARAAAPCLRDRLLVLDPGGEFELDPAVYGLRACLADLERTGIDVAVVSCPPTLGIEGVPELLDAYHEGALAAVESTGGRVQALSLAQPLEGFVGTCVSAGALWDVDRLAPVLDDVERRGTFLFVHPGPARPPAGAPAWWAAVVDYTAQMQSAYAAWLANGVDRWPNLKLLFAILAGGAPFQLERLQSRGDVDIRTAIRSTLFLDAASYGRRALELCFATFGARQIVYGSDAPVLDARLTLEPVRSFGQAATDALCCENPHRLLT